MKFEAESLVVEMAILALFRISEKVEIFDFIQEHIGKKPNFKREG